LWVGNDRRRERKNRRQKGKDRRQRIRDRRKAQYRKEGKIFYLFE
jgi:hypothetical protein